MTSFPGSTTRTHSLQRLLPSSWSPAHTRTDQHSPNDQEDPLEVLSGALSPHNPLNSTVSPTNSSLGGNPLTPNCLQLVLGSRPWAQLDTVGKSSGGQGPPSQGQLPRAQLGSL